MQIQEQEEVARDYYNQLEAELLRIANEQKVELEKKAQEVIKTIPTDYAQMQKDVNNLKEDLVNVNYAVSTTADNYTIASADMESGTIDKTTGVESESNNTIRSKDFIDISNTKSFVFLELLQIFIMLELYIMILLKHF